MSLAAVKEALKQDAEWKRYRAIRSGIEESFPLESLNEELTRIQRGRKVRSVSFKGVSAQRLLDMSMDEVQHRARLTEILIQAKRESNILSALLDGMNSYVLGEYAEDLREGFKTQQDRRSAVDRLLSKGYSTLYGIQGVAETTELLIKDIDQSSFTLTRVANLIELTTRREHVANVSV